jgi:hypothetical protein
MPMFALAVSVFFRTRVDELTPPAVEGRYDYFPAPASFERAKTRSPVPRTVWLLVDSEQYELQA